MAQNDMYVVMYKVLAYLYDCMKRGAEPEDARWCASALGIPESYWTAVVSQLVEHGFVSGVTVTDFMGGKCLVTPINPIVTMEGVAFMENGMMRKALRFLQDTKAAIPGL